MCSTLRSGFSSSRRGGNLRVAYAPGVGELEREMERAARGGASAAGYVLLLMARLDTFHPEMTPSLNRAVRVIEAARKHVPGLKWRTDSKVKEDWKKWKAVAPLWAAWLVFNFIASAPAPTTGVPPSPEELIITFNTPSVRSRFVAWARWFRRFALDHVASPGQPPAMSEAQAVLIVPEDPILHPPLTPLSDWELDAARSYKAPMAR
jgi:hypothetical protein